MTARARRHAAVLLVRGLLLLVGSSPLWVPLARMVPELGWLTEVFEAWFALQCHLNGQRGLDSFGLGLAVCARCSGIYLGLALGALLVRPRLAPAVVRIWVLSAATLMLLDVSSEALGLRPSCAWGRLATGLLLAFPVAIVSVQAASERCQARC